MTLCDTCSMCVRTKYQQEIYNTFFKNTFEDVTHRYCMSMQQDVRPKIIECNRYIPENK